MNDDALKHAAPHRPMGPQVVTVISPRSGWQWLDLVQLWSYRELFGFLALRDIQVRYKQTMLGALWAVIQPFVLMVVMSMFFGRVIDMEDKTGGVPYPIFLYAGLLPWTFFAAAVSASTNSMVNNANMLRKVYFPRLVIPLSSVGAPLLDYAVAFGVLLGLMLWYGVAPTMGMLLLPLLVAVTVIAALGVGIAMSGLTVRYRDFRYVAPFLLNVWFFVTPVIWPVKIVSPQYHWILRAQPDGRHDRGVPRRRAGPSDSLGSAGAVDRGGFVMPTRRRSVLHPRRATFRRRGLTA